MKKIWSGHEKLITKRFLKKSSLFTSMNLPTDNLMNCKRWKSISSWWNLQKPSKVIFVKKRITDPLKNTLQYLKKYCEVNENHAENSIKNVQKPF